MSFPSSASSTAAAAEALWARARARMASVGALGRAERKAWIDPLRPVAWENETLTLAAPDAQHRSFVSARFGAEIETRLGQAAGAPVRARFVVAPARMADAPESAARAEATRAHEPFLAPFLEGRANAAARAAMLALVAESPPMGASPLFVHGPHGVGKTALLHAGADALRARGLKVALMTGEEFVQDFTSALRARALEPFKRRLREADAWFVDDFHAAAASGEATRRELLFVFNAMEKAGRRMAFAASAPPARLEGAPPALISRLGGGMMAEMKPADPALRLAVLRRAALARAPDASALDDALIELARGGEGDLRLALGALNRLIAQAAHAPAPLTAADARARLAEASRAAPRAPISVAAIQRFTAEAFDLPLDELMSRRRARDVARARQVAMYLAKTLTRRSLPDVGRRFGGRDHTTVMHAVRRVEGLMRDDPELRARVEALATRLRVERPQA